MARAFLAMQGAGLKNLCLGNFGVFLKNDQDASYLAEKLEKDFF